MVQHKCRGVKLKLGKRKEEGEEEEDRRKKAEYLVSSSSDEILTVFWCVKAGFSCLLIYLNLILFKSNPFRVRITLLVF